MSLNPTSFRFPFEAQIAKLPANVQEAHRAAFNAITDLYQANAALSAKVNGSSSSASSTTTTNNVTTTTETIVEQASPNVGFVNYQTGVTSYSTAQSDYGKVIVLNDASPIAVILSGAVNGITLPFYCRFFNEGAGTATLTPGSGTVNGSASYSLTTGNSINIFWDGTNFIAS